MDFEVGMTKWEDCTEVPPGILCPGGVKWLGPRRMLVLYMSWWVVSQLVIEDDPLPVYYRPSSVIVSGHPAQTKKPKAQTRPSSLWGSGRDRSQAQNWRTLFGWVVILRAAKAVKQLVRRKPKEHYMALTRSGTWFQDASDASGVTGLLTRLRWRKSWK